MPEVLTESFCERCGTKYALPVPEGPLKSGGVKRAKLLARGFKNYVLSNDPLDEAFAEARSDEDRLQAARQVEAFHQVFNFCMQCRQYTCANCWNQAERRCLTCAPLPFGALADPLLRLGGAPSDGTSVAATEPQEASRPTIDASAWPTADLAAGTASGEGLAADSDVLQLAPGRAYEQRAPVSPADVPAEPGVSEEEAFPERPPLGAPRAAWEESVPEEPPALGPWTPDDLVQPEERAGATEAGVRPEAPSLASEAEVPFETEVWREAEVPSETDVWPEAEVPSETEVWPEADADVSPDAPSLATEAEVSLSERPALAEELPQRLGAYDDSAAAGEWERSRVARDVPPPEPAHEPVAPAPVTEAPPTVEPAGAELWSDLGELAAEHLADVPPAEEWPAPLPVPLEEREAPPERLPPDEPQAVEEPTRSPRPAGFIDRLRDAFGLANRPETTARTEQAEMGAGPEGAEERGADPAALEAPTAGVEPHVAPKPPVVAGDPERAALEQGPPAAGGEPQVAPKPPVVAGDPERAALEQGPPAAGG
ncbi:MAG: hypothetical protein M3301_01875, partial [Chloroflexota bacterium]|nr:hypothetical protein [Chloroflexota bacterium]